MTASSLASAPRKIGSFFVFLICGGFAAFTGTAAFSGQEISWSMLSTTTMLLGVLPLPLIRFVGAAAAARRNAKAAADPEATLTLQRSALAVAAMVWMFMAFAAACGFGLASGIEDLVTRVAVWAGLFLFAFLGLSTPFHRGRERLICRRLG